MISAMTINCKGKLLNCSKPLVMGILNVTPDSFSDGGIFLGLDAALQQAEKMLCEGASIIDVGGMSTRPNADVIDEKEELKRVLPVVNALVRKFPDAVISIDTVRAEVAKQCVEEGAAIVNDVSAGNFDAEMISTVALLQAPYIIMHNAGIPANATKPNYSNVVLDVFDFLQNKIAQCKATGIADVMVDVGFGFGKSLEENFALLNELEVFRLLEAPMLVGVSRKSMITKTLNIDAASSQNGTTALNTIALIKGAKILRVHDVKNAVEAVDLFCATTGVGR